MTERHSGERLAFFGERGAYGEEAARQVGGASAELVPCPTPAAVLETVHAGLAQRGLLPVENSHAGTVPETLDVSLGRLLHVVGEHVLRVHHCLMAIPGATLEALTEARSHPQALAQCDAFLQAHRLTPVATSNTATAARELAERRWPYAAAVGSRAAAAHYGLTVLAEDIETSTDNATRFWIFAPTPPPVSDSAPAKTALAFTLPASPAGLVRALKCFAERGVEVRSLATRPRHTAPWRYRYFLEVDGHAGLPPLAAALEALHGCTDSVRVLGSFPATIA